MADLNIYDSSCHRSHRCSIMHRAYRRRPPENSAGQCRQSGRQPQIPGSSATLPRAGLEVVPSLANEQLRLRGRDPKENASITPVVTGGQPDSDAVGFWPHRKPLLTAFSASFWRNITKTGGSKSLDHHPDQQKDSPPHRIQPTPKHTLDSGHGIRPGRTNSKGNRPTCSFRAKLGHR